MDTPVHITPVMSIQNFGYGLIVSSLQGPWKNLSINLITSAFGLARDYFQYLFIENSDNHRNPNRGTPNSTGRIYHPDGSPKQEREYGDEGERVVDHDHHPGEDVGYDHDHDWINGQRQPARSPSKIELILGAIGAGLIIVGLIADDITGFGAGDDFLIPATTAVLISCILVLFESGSDSEGEYS